MLNTTRRVVVNDNERRIARKEFEKKRTASRLNLGNQLQMWIDVKKIEHMITNSQTAELLLDW